MAKKKKTSLIEKRTDAHLEEVYLRFIKPLQDDPDFLDRIGYPIYLSPEIYEKLNEIVELIFSEDDPIAFLKEKLNRDSYELLRLLPKRGGWELERGVWKEGFAPHPHLSEKQPFILGLHFRTREPLYGIYLSYSNNVIMEAIDREIESVEKHGIDWIYPRPRATAWAFGAGPIQLLSSLSDSKKVIEVRAAPGQCLRHLDSDLLLVSINFDAGKMEIRRALKEVLKKFSPRDTERTPKFSPETWKRNYEIYGLHYDRGFTFKEIRIKLNMEESAVKKAYKQIYQHIHQVDEYGTAETRGELSVNIAERSPISVEDAENIYYRTQMLGGFGNKMAPSAAYESAGLTWTPDLPKSDKAFENWRKRFGQSSECWDCKRVPGSEVCSGCNQALEPVYYSRGLRKWRIEPGKAVKRAKPLERRSDYPLKGEWEPSHFREIYESIQTQHLRLPKEQELKLQADYIKHNGIEILPPKKAPKPRTSRYTFRITPHSSGQYSLRPKKFHR